MRFCPHPQRLHFHRSPGRPWDMCRGQLIWKNCSGSRGALPRALSTWAAAARPMEGAALPPRPRASGVGTHG
eukprot:472016-Pyramimonas_sp.AAC.1